MQMFKHSLIAALALTTMATALAAGHAEDASPFVSATAAYRQGVAELK